ncbi:hypothetical protein [Pseudomonas sp. Sample_16]|uniref:hypothetical protein n=1 Tax=Pseudomonas sp. Sample_16 TaxID=2448263 RepID=UPI001032C050|nr:hypothetical protein [Pseudomonas sp. Sample_16]
MLASRKAGTVPDGFNSTLDLGWFFGVDPAPVDSAATEASLRSLHEAQARIISVSPPIGLIRK